MKSETKKVGAKWGFGMALVKPHIQNSRNEACEALLSLLDMESFPESGKKYLEPISIVQGLFNRTVFENQWDWFTVCAQLGYPSRNIAQKIADNLRRMRSSIKSCDLKEFNQAKNNLSRLPTRTCLNVFLGLARIVSDSDSGWIYILSTREWKDVLKIGMTTRSVEQRVQEINRATGVAIPFGVRRCWHVHNPQLLEKLAHQALTPFRIRDDREFFHINHAKAMKILNSVISDSGCEIKTLKTVSNC